MAAAAPLPALVNAADEARFIADVAAELVGDDNVNRDGGLVMASVGFSSMLERRPGAYIQIGNGDDAGGCEVHKLPFCHPSCRISGRDPSPRHCTS
jgi:metal-dependent amidase/aminoacylase/carboxypeptidase family protein